MKQADSTDQPVDLPFTDEDRRQYRILGVLGEGGMGTVYLAYSSARQGTVAIKVVQDRVSQTELRRFADESRILARLDDHPQMVTLLGSGLLSDGRPYLVMKLVSGVSLERRLAEGALANEEIIEITCQLGEALSFAHRQGVIHRDIKPSNIMLSNLDDQLLVKVLDFGIAILRDAGTAAPENFTQVGQGRLTPAYASPEQAMGKRRHEIDHRTDIYSMGCVVYEMVTGKRPFDSDSIEAVLYQRISQAPPTPAQRRPDLLIPASVDRVLLKALARSPDERYAEARAFAAAFQTAMRESLVTDTTATAVLTRTTPVPPTISKPRPYWLPLALTLILVLAAGSAAAVKYFVFPTTPATEPSANPPSPERAVHPASPTAAAAAPSAEANATGASLLLNLEMRMYRLLAQRAEEVPLQTVFRDGDAIYWQLRPSQAGYLYIVFQGNSGTVSLVYPNRHEVGSYDLHIAGQPVTFPKPGSPLRFDSQPGDETCYFIFATQKGESQLAALERAVKQRRLTLRQREGEQLVGELQAAGASQQASVFVRRITLQHR